MNIRSLIPFSAICGAVLVPAFASLSNLDRKYNTGGTRQTSTNRKHAASHTSKPAKKVKQAKTTKEQEDEKMLQAFRKINAMPDTINPAENKDLAANLELVSSMFLAWKNGDDQPLLEIFAPTVNAIDTPWTGGQITNIPAKEAIAVLYDAPRSYIDDMTCDEAYYVAWRFPDHVYFLSLCFQNEQGKSVAYFLVLDEAKKITNLYILPFVHPPGQGDFRALSMELLGSTTKPAFIHPIHISTTSPQGRGEPIAAKQGATGTARHPDVAGVGTWGTVDADFSDSHLVLQTEKMLVPEKWHAAVLSQYLSLRTDPVSYRQAVDERKKLLQDLATRPDLAGKLPPLLNFKNAIHLLGEDREVSRDEFIAALESRVLRWPLNAKLEAVSVTGGHLSATYVLGAFGYVEPIHLHTDFLLDAEGNVTAIGETQLSSAPVAWADHAAGTWGQRNAVLTRDPALTHFTEPVAHTDDAGFSKQATAVAARYLSYRSQRALARRQSGDFSSLDPFRDDAADVTVFGASAKMSFAELQYALLDPALCFPERSTVIACGTKDRNKVEVIYKLEPPGQKEPVYLKTLFAFNPQGDITAVGETLCNNTAASLDEGFAQVAPPSSL